MERARRPSNGEVDRGCRRWTVEIRALRANSEAEAERLRRSLPQLIAGIIAEVPGTQAEFGLSCSESGETVMEVLVDPGDPDLPVADELGAALNQVAETLVHRRKPHRGAWRVWPMLAEPGSAELGFAAHPRQQAHATLAPPLSDGGEGFAEEMLRVLAGLPGQGIRVLLAAPGRGADQWEARIAVVASDAAPSLRLRAALRRLLPGLRIGSVGDHGARVRLSTADLPRVLPIAVAASVPLPGVCVGEPAPIPVPPALPSGAGHGDSVVRIGYGVDTGGRHRPVELRTGERLRHLHVLGRTGTGKSSLLAALAHGVARGRDGLLLADPHGQLCERVLAELPDAARDRVWLIRCGDAENPVPLNPLAEADTARREIAIAEICDVFQYLFDKNSIGIVGPRFRERVAMALRAMAALQGQRTSLLDVPAALADDTFMDAAVVACRDARVEAWWRNDKRARSSNDHGEVVSWVNSKFETFAGTAAMRAVLGSGCDAVDFAAAMDEGRIILLDLSKAELGDAASRLLGYLYLSRVWAAALRRSRPDKPFHVIVDEAHSLISASMATMLAEGRKFGLSVTLAHQYLSQLDDDLRPAVDGNVATTVAFRCAAGDAAEFARRFGGLVDPSVFMTLPDLAAVCQRTSGPAAMLPHTLIVDHNQIVTPRAGSEAAHSRATILRDTDRDLVDPFREATGAAAEGRSVFTTADLRTDAGSPDPPESASGVGFLDSWLQERVAARESED